LKDFNVNNDGLSDQEVLHRRQTFGFNTLQQKEKRGIFKVVLDQFKDIMIIILIFAALLGIVFGIVKKIQGEHE
jgi:Ca2+-transporting ATPase